MISIRSGLYPSKNGGSLSRSISPKFPVVLSKQLVRIIAHLFGDGNLSVNSKGHLNVAYYNQDSSLMNQFIKDINDVFNINKDNVKVNKTTPYLLLPSPIGVILLGKISDLACHKNCSWSGGCIT